jgi:Flp pilus assembly protein TadD
MIQTDDSRAHGKRAAWCIFAAALSGCGSAGKAPAVPVFPSADASVAIAPPAETRAPPADSAAAPPVEAGAVAPLPVTVKLARGDGTPADFAIADGDTAFDADDFVRAETRYREAARAAPRDPAPLVGLARVAIAKTGVATDYAAARRHPDLERAAADLGKAIKLDPTYAPARTELGRALLILGKAEQALASLRKAVDLGARDPEAHSALGVALLATGRTEEASEELRQAADLDPGNVARQTNYATALLMCGKVTDAVRVYDAAVRAAPANARINGDLGAALLADNQIDRSIVFLIKAVALDPKSAAFRSNLGYALQQKHDLPGAIVQYREAVKLDQKLASGWINLATALAQIGHYEEAKEALDRAKKIDPTDPRVKANLDELRDLQTKRTGATPK